MSTDLNWHKSSYSSASSDNCIEVADNAPGTVRVRDTKDHSKGELKATATAWAAFVTQAKGAQV